MTTVSNLDISGNLSQNPLAELLVEIADTELSGSLRLADSDRKSVIYLRNGQAVHAVSNQREHRLFSIGLAKRLLTKEILGKYPNFANDIEFAAALKRGEDLTADQVDELTAAQIESILISALSLANGDWTYSPHARLRSDLASNVAMNRLLIDLARCLPSSIVAARFRSLGEEFIKFNGEAPNVELQPHEEFVLGLFGDRAMTLEELRGISTLPDSGLLNGLYALWLSGFITRREWTRAFNSSKLDAVRTARFAKTSDAVQMPSEKPVATASAPPPPVVEAQAAPTPTSVMPEITIDEYLDRVENAETYYDILGVDQKSSTDELKRNYFTYAKHFHPDRFHRVEPEKHARIQRSFTQLAHAYETLKLQESREAYDYKVRKELEIKARRAADGSDKIAGESVNAEQGLTNFENGLEKFQEEDYAAAATFLARAVHFSPQNALYKAHFGKALSYTGSKYRHKAESELQEAVKLEPGNPKIRMMLIEFFLDMDMNRRAEGELRRFLEIAPGNKEALEMMNRMQEMIA
jgi:curved DNA-binding protein CbpA